MFLRTLSAFLLGLFCLSSPATAQARKAAFATPWVKSQNSQVRLILPPLPDRVNAGTVMYGGLELRLDSGGKTYWRTPGDTGVPPVIDFGTSEGLSEIRFEFPPPVVFDDGAGGKAYGYKEGKIFPVRFKVQQPLERGKVVVAPNASASPAKGSPPPAPAAEPKLSLNMEYGVCLRNMCVPAVAAVAMGFGEGELELGLGDRLDNAVASLPQKQAIGRGEGIGISIIQGARKPGVIELEIAARIGEGVQEAELFVEGRDPYAVVQRGAAIGGVILFKVRGDRPLPDPAPTKENPEKFGPATLTLVTPSKAVEIAVDLDAVVKPH